MQEQQPKRPAIQAGSANTPGLRKSFKARHLTMIALGGSIGTGLFLASGGAIASSGPGEHCSPTRPSALWSIF